MTTLEPRPDERFRRALIRAVVLPGILLACLTAVFLGLIAELLATTAWVEHTDRILARTHRLRAWLAERDTRLRGHLLTGSPVLLPPPDAATRSWEADLDELARLVADNPDQQRRLAELRRDLARWDGQVQELTDLGRRSASDLRQFDAVAVDKALMDTIRHRLAGFVAVEEWLRDRRSQTARSTVWLTVGSGLGATLVLGTLLVSATRRQIVSMSRTYEQALDVARRQAEAVSQLAAIVESTDDAIIGKDLDGSITSWNAGAERLYGYAAGEVLGRPIALLLPPGQDDDVPRILAGVRAGRAARYETRRRRRDGTILDVAVTASPVRDADGRIVAASVIARDITRGKCAEARLAHQARHDALTGLPNRAQLQEKLEQALNSSRGDDAAFALLVLDLDGFKAINDSFGHRYGDAVLRQVGLRLSEAVRESDRIARLGGDEFAILLPGADQAMALAVADRILDAFTSPMMVEGQPLEVGISLGIALYPEHGRSPDTLLEHADLAMYAAKRSRIGRAVYTAAPAGGGTRPPSLVGELSRAITEHQLLLYYQPQFDLRTMRLGGVEALIRWQHPQEGLIAAAEFLPLVERTGLIRPLSLWALEAALRQCSAWHQAALHLPVAVNLAADHLLDERLAETTARLLDESGAPPGWLTVEVTEDALRVDPMRVKAGLERVHEIGVRIAIDDFGTGYSSLAHLKDLPVDELKVDRTFLKDLATNQRDACLVRSVIELGHRLGSRVVAEGVEDPAVLDQLSSWGCDLAQGYYFSRPLSGPDFLTWMAASLGRGAEEPLEDSRLRYQHAS